jgi:GTP-binding protein Era
LEKAYPSYGSWDYNEKLLTNKDPRRLVLETLKSKILEVLPNDVPYKMNPELETWQNENGMLKILASVDSEKPRTTNLLLNESAKNLRTIAKLTVMCIMFFRV